MTILWSSCVQQKETEGNNGHKIIEAKINDSLSITIEKSNCLSILISKQSNIKHTNSISIEISELSHMPSDIYEKNDGVEVTKYYNIESIMYMPSHMTTLINGQMTGLGYHYGNGGHLVSISNYHHNVMDGEYIHYSSNNKVINRTLFKNGIEIQNNNEKSLGVIEPETIERSYCQFIRSQINDSLTVLIKYNDSGKISYFELNNLTNRTDYCYEFLDDEIRLSSVYQKQNGLLNGYCFKYYDSGQLRVREFYKNGKLNGEVLTFKDEAKETYKSYFECGEEKEVYADLIADDIVIAEME